MSDQSILQFLSSQGVPLLLGAVGGGIVSGLVTWRMLRANTLRQLVADALAIQAEKEAWILEGPIYGNTALFKQKGLSTVHSNTSLWLRRVEVRAVLDEAQWTQLLDQEYGFISGRRAWIVRDSVTGPRAYIGALGGGWHPALASSRAIEDLCGWVEQVAAARNGWLLRKRDLVILKPLLQALRTKDRLDVFGKRLSDNARKFLEDYYKRHV